jgi:hypothetical protein
MNAFSETADQDWEVWPSVDIGVGDLLREQTPPGTDPFIEISTEAATTVLRSRQADDSIPGIVRLNVSAGGTKLNHGPLGRARNKNILSLGVAKPLKKEDHDIESDVPYVSEITVSAANEHGDMDSLMNQVVSVHELDHAAKMSSAEMMKREKRFKIRTAANYMGPVLLGEAAIFGSPEAAVTLTGLGLILVGGWRIFRKLPMALYTKSPLEKSAYSTTMDSVFYPPVIKHTAPSTPEQMLILGMPGVEIPGEA